MITFKTFIVEGTYKLSDSEREQIENLVDRYMHYFGAQKMQGLLGREKNPKKVYKKELNEKGEFFLGLIKYTDLETPDQEEQNIYVDVSFEEPRARADFLQDEKKITLYFYGLDNTSKSLIRNVITHELLHAKQQFKKKGKEYRKAVQIRNRPSGQTTIRSKRGYFFHPTEFNVHVTVIVNGIENQYNDLNKKIDDARDEGDQSQIRFWQNKKIALLNFLKTFIKTGGRLSKDVPLPPFIQNDYEFIVTLIRNRKSQKYSKYFKSFFKSISRLYSQLIEYENR